MILGYPLSDKSTWVPQKQCTVWMVKFSRGCLIDEDDGQGMVGYRCETARFPLLSIQPLARRNHSLVSRELEKGSSQAIQTIEHGNEICAISFRCVPIHRRSRQSLATHGFLLPDSFGDAEGVGRRAGQFICEDAEDVQCGQSPNFGALVILQGSTSYYRICTHAYVYVCMYVYIYIKTYVIYVYTYVRTSIHMYHDFSKKNGWS